MTVTGTLRPQLKRAWLEAAWRLMPKTTFVRVLPSAIARRGILNAENGNIITTLPPGVAWTPSPSTPHHGGHQYRKRPARSLHQGKQPTAYVETDAANMMAPKPSRSTPKRIAVHHDRRVRAGCTRRAARTSRAPAAAHGPQAPFSDSDGRQAVSRRSCSANPAGPADVPKSVPRSRATRDCLPSPSPHRNRRLASSALQCLPDRFL